MISKGANHCLKECNFPKLTVLNVGCKVMLLINELKEYKLINGSIGIVKEILFEHKDGPKHIPYKLPACVIVEFKECTFAEGTKWQTNLEKNSFHKGSYYIKRKQFDKLLKIKDAHSRRIVKDNISKFHLVDENEKQTLFGWMRLSPAIVFEQS